MIKILFCGSLFLLGCSKTGSDSVVSPTSSQQTIIDENSSNSNSKDHFSTSSSNPEPFGESSSSRESSSSEKREFVLPENNFDYTQCEKEKTCGIFIDQRDHRSYRWVSIDSNVWMGENLKFKIGLNHLECPHGQEDLCEKIGNLYSWNQAMQYPSLCNETICKGATKSSHQGICPEGWRLPNYVDIDKLFFYAYMEEKKEGESSFVRVSKHLRVDGWEGGYNTYGFSAIPSINDDIAFWTADHETIYSIETYVYTTDGNRWSTTDKKKPFPVRCIKGEEVERVETRENGIIDCGELPENSFCDERDGEIYTFKKFGFNYWMTQNLRYSGHNENGSTKKLGSCAFDDECLIYGRTYSHTKSTVSKCPIGWRFPVKYDWNNLMRYLSDQGMEVADLKVVMNDSLTEWNNEAHNHNNSTGFFMSPISTDPIDSKARFAYGTIDGSDEFSTLHAVFYGNGKVNLEVREKDYVNSNIRCVKEDWSSPSE